MSEFNPMTIAAAAEIIEGMKTQAEFTTLALQWGVADRCAAGSVRARVNAMAQIAIGEERQVYTLNGLQSLERAMMEVAIGASPAVRRNSHDAWLRLVAGLRFDGFEVVDDDPAPAVELPWSRSAPAERTTTLQRMLPAHLPGLDYREAESEIAALLKQHGFQVAKGHLDQALHAFQAGHWTSANGELRKFSESYLNEIAVALGYTGDGKSGEKRQFLSKSPDPSFLLEDYEEGQYVRALMTRMHPHGGHEGLSEEEDATFRLQIVLITARLFLRRYDQRVRGGA